MGTYIFKINKKMHYLKNVILGSALISCVSSYAVHPEKPVDQHRQHSKDFWIEQFKPFEKNGITEEMMFRAKKEYFSNGFKTKMNSIIP